MSIFSIKKFKKRFLIYPLFAYLEKIKYNPKYANFSYSQEGEDMILRRIFEKKKKDFMLILAHTTQNAFLIRFIFINAVGME